MEELEQNVRKEFILIYSQKNFLETFHNNTLKTIELNNYNIKTTHGGFKEIVLANGDTFNIPNMPKEGELNIENIFKAPYMIT